MRLVGQSLGGTIFLPAATSIFQNILLQTLQDTTPSIPVAQIVAVGVADLQSKFPAAQLSTIRGAYLHGLHDAFVLALAVSAVSLVLACLFPWKKLMIRKTDAKGTGESEEKSATV
jgi:hypothetical protein